MPILRSYYQEVYRSPVVRLDGYSGRHGLEAGILAYLDFGGATGTSKDGLAETMLAFATERGTLQPGMPVVEVSSGSFGAALAILLTRCLLGGLFAGNLSAMLFSVLGGLTAMLVMIFLRRLPRLSVYGVSIGGAAAHNIGQMAAAVITLGSTMVLGYLPFLLAVSLFTGALTGFITALLLRATRHIRFH